MDDIVKKGEILVRTLQTHFENGFDDFKSRIDDELMSLASYVDDQISTIDESGSVHAPKLRKKNEI